MEPRSPVAIIADTHLPRGGRRLPQRCVAVIADCEAVLHAGDIVTRGALRELEAIGPPVHAVHGNVDEPALRRALPVELTLSLGGHEVVVVHDAGPTRGRLGRLHGRYPEAAAVVFGHSHMPAHESLERFQIFNPGSPTERRRAPERSMGLAHVVGDSLEFEHVRLP